MCAGLVLYHLIGSELGGQAIYSAASSQDQAAQIYRYCYAMIKQDPYLDSQCKCLDGKKTIEYLPTGNTYKALSSDHKGSHSIKPSVCIVDELHLFEGHRGRLLWDALHTGSSSIDEPLWITITTAGYDKRSLCYEEYTKAKSALASPESYPDYLAVIHEYQGEDWDKPENWQQANPALNDFVKLRAYEDLCRDAKELPTRQNVFRQLYLNTWTESSCVWIPVSKWDECDTGFDVTELDGLNCVGAGLDLSSVKDLTSLCLVFEWETDHYRVIFFNWIPEASALERTKRDNQPYQHWLKTGDLNPTPGNAVDYDQVRLDILKIHKRFPIQKLALDPWNATFLAQKLMDDGIPVEYYRQGFGSMNAPSKLLERLILNHKLEHEGNPIARWAIGNTVAETDAAGNIKPSKSKSTERIDPIVALVCALGVAMCAEPACGDFFVMDMNADNDPKDDT